MKISILVFLTLLNSSLSDNEHGNIPIKLKQPNFILMNMDDLGWGDLGVMGHPAKETPNLDRMADQGILFPQFYTSAAICSPSRASLLTGRLPVRNGFYQSTYPGRNAYTPQKIMGGISSSELLLSEVLGKVGYRTKLVGKWHLGHRPQYLPLKHGFHEWFGAPNCHFKYGGHRAGPNIPVYKDEMMLGRYYEKFQIDIQNGSSNWTQLLLESSLEFISRNHSNPYFLYWAPDSTHAPAYSSPSYVGSSRRESFFGDAVKEIDDAVGAILETVKQMDGGRDTLVVFTSDNGAALVSREHAGSNGPLLCGKQTTFEGGMRTPTIAWWSNSQRDRRRKCSGNQGEGRVSHQVGTHMDILPSFADLGGAVLPPSLVLDGISLASVLLSDVSFPRPVFFYRGGRLFAVRYGDHKAHLWTWTTPMEEIDKGIDHCPDIYITNVTTHTQVNHTAAPVLFNLERDPGERYPIPQSSKEYQIAITTLRKVVKDHQDGMVAGKPQLNWCDRAVMNWAPNGCQQLNDCHKPPPSKPYKCFWPH